MKELVTKIRKFFRPEQEKETVYILDGDQSQSLYNFRKVMKRYGAEKAHFVSSSTIPRVIKKSHFLKKHDVSGVSSKGKETTDKYIGLMLQNFISNGYRSFGIVSDDKDFLAMGEMLRKINPNVELEYVVYSSTDFKGIKTHNTRFEDVRKWT